MLLKFNLVWDQPAKTLSSLNQKVQFVTHLLLGS